MIMKRVYLNLNLMNLKDIMMRSPSTKNTVHRLLLDEANGGIRSLPKTVRFHILLLLCWPLFLILALSFRDPFQLIWVFAVIPAIIGLYLLVKFGIPYFEKNVIRNN